MTHEEAINFIQPVIRPNTEVWADLGAGSGVFTRALADLLGAGSQVYAVYKSANVHQIQGQGTWAEIQSVQQDFSAALDFEELDGILMANSIHYILRKASLLEKLKSLLVPDGKLLMIEYDRSIPNPWVPYPLSYTAFEKLCRKTGFAPPQEINRRQSRYGQGEMYAAVTYKL